jgi:hypothetical protein
MLTQDEKTRIQSLVRNGETVPDYLKAKLLQSIKNGEPGIFQGGNDDHLCCAYKDTVGEIQYAWLTYDECRAFGGRAADNSKCGK